MFSFFIHQYFFNHLGNIIDKYTQSYEGFVLISNFNAEDSEPCLSEFLYNADESSTSPSSFDLFLQNFAISFPNTCAFTKGLSDFPKMVVNLMKITFRMTPLKEIYYRHYKHFC